MSAREFTIPVTDLDAAGKEYAFPVRSRWVAETMGDGEAKATDHDGELVVRASKSGHDVVVRGRLDADLDLPCARCLERFTAHVHSDLSVIYVPSSRLRPAEGGEQDHDLSPEEADTLPFDGETVALDDLVRDELVLEIPMIPLCSEACPGMSPAPEPSPEAGSQESVDPRLAPLLQFKSKATKQ